MATVCSQVALSPLPPRIKPPASSNPEDMLAWAHETTVVINAAMQDLYRAIGILTTTPQTVGAGTAGASYTATEQGMLQRVYDAVRTYGIGT